MLILSLKQFPYLFQFRFNLILIDICTIMNTYVFINKHLRTPFQRLKRAVLSRLNSSGLMFPVSKVEFIFRFLTITIGSTAIFPVRSAKG